MFVLGIDPGLSRCGYGVISIKNQREKAIAAGVIRTAADEMTHLRLYQIRNEVRSLITEYSPEVSHRKSPLPAKCENSNICKPSNWRGHG